MNTRQGLKSHCTLKKHKYVDEDGSDEDDDCSEDGSSDDDDT